MAFQNIVDSIWNWRKDYMDVRSWMMQYKNKGNVCCYMMMENVDSTINQS